MNSKTISSPSLKSFNNNKNNNNSHKNNNYLLMKTKINLTTKKISSNNKFNRKMNHSKIKILIITPENKKFQILRINIKRINHIHINLINNLHTNPLQRIIMLSLITLLHNLNYQLIIIKLLLDNYHQIIKLKTNNQIKIMKI